MRWEDKGRFFAAWLDHNKVECKRRAASVDSIVHDEKFCIMVV